MTTVTIHVNPPPVVTYTNATVAAIPDAGILISEISVTDDFNVHDLNLRIDLGHQRLADLRGGLEKLSAPAVILTANRLILS